MSQVSHSRRAAPALRLAAGTLLGRAVRQLRRADVVYGHGTDNARDDAAALLMYVLGATAGLTSQALARTVTTGKRLAFEALVQRRIRERLPAVYLTGTTWFAGVPMRIDPRALIPRSPLAELIEKGFHPWADAQRVRRVLDLGTGSGCIAIACAVYLPRARIDAVDISPAALTLARQNARDLGLSRRVRCLLSDHFTALAGRRYDIIVSNPPYVGDRELKTLPAEYRHEPRIALAAGRLGLDSVRVILRKARRHLNPGGLLIVEVGNTETAVRRAYPAVPFVWLEFTRGGGGVFLLTREQLSSGR